MKNLFYALLMVVLLAGCGDIDRNDPRIAEDQLPSDLTRDEAALLRDVRQMFERDDISGMMARVHNAGVMDDFWLEIQEDYLRDILEGRLGHIYLERIDPPRTSETLPDGSVAEWSLPLKWKMIIYQPEDASNISISHSIAFSYHEGRIVIIRQIIRKNKTLDSIE